jgi:hypothetical protein
MVKKVEELVPGVKLQKKKSSEVKKDKVKSEKSP